MNGILEAFIDQITIRTEFFINSRSDQHIRGSYPKKCRYQLQQLLGFLQKMEQSYLLFLDQLTLYLDQFYSLSFHH